MALVSCAITFPPAVVSFESVFSALLPLEGEGRGRFALLPAKNRSVKRVNEDTLAYGRMLSRNPLDALRLLLVSHEGANTDLCAIFSLLHFYYAYTLFNMANW